VINKLTTQAHCRTKTYDDVTGSSYNTVSHRRILNNLHALLVCDYWPQVATSLSRRLSIF